MVLTAPEQPARPAGPQAAPTVVELASAVRAGALTVALQPVVDLRDGAACGAESLVRWVHPRLGLLLPDRFLPLARSGGLSAEVDLLVLSTACRHLADDPAAAPASVNVSRESLLQPGFAVAVLRTLRAHEVDGDRVLLELSEELTLDDLDVLGGELRLLRAHGVRLVLDDLGAGATTLHHVQALRPAWVKVDRALVTDCDADPRRLSLVRRVVDLAGSLGAGVTAEGVERAAEADALRGAGCERGQGWLFGRPVLQPRTTGGPAGGR